MTGRRRGPSRLCGPCSVTWTAARLLDDRFTFLLGGNDGEYLLGEDPP